MHLEAEQRLAGRTEAGLWVRKATQVEYSSWSPQETPPPTYQDSTPGDECWLGPWPVLTLRRTSYSPSRRLQWDRRRSQEGRAGLPAEVGVQLRAHPDP